MALVPRVFYVVVVGRILTPWDAIEHLLANKGVGEEAAGLLGFVAGYTLPLTVGFGIIAFFVLTGKNKEFEWYQQLIGAAVILGVAGEAARALGLGLLPDYTGWQRAGGPPYLRPLVVVLGAYLNTYGGGLVLCALAIGSAGAIQVERWLHPTILTTSASEHLHTAPTISSSVESLSASGNTVQTQISRGLIIRSEPLENILSGRKVWEMRSRPTHVRGTVALVKKGSKAIYGVADIVDSRGPLTRAEMVANQSRHLISLDRLDHPEIAKYRYAWMLANVRRLKVPIPYVHKGGVQFVTLDELAVSQLMRALQT